MTRSRRYEEVLDEDLQQPAEAAGYLNACLEEGDAEVFLLALRDVARARGGIAKLAEVTELNREHLYRMLSENVGVFCEPASAAGVAGILKFRADLPEGPVVCTVTGHGLKDTDIVLKSPEPFLELPADLAVVEKELGLV